MNTGVSSHSLLQGIFPIQGSNLGILHCTQIHYHLSYKGSPGGISGGSKNTWVGSCISEILFEEMSSFLGSPGTDPATGPWGGLDVTAESGTGCGASA